MIRPAIRFDWSPDPFMDLYRVGREVSRLVSGAEAPSILLPNLNFWSNDDEAVVTAEIPGVDPKEVQLSVAGDVLTLECERKADEISATAAHHLMERGVGKFQRAIRLPFDVETAKVQAKYEHGVVRITLPRKESTKPRRIDIVV